MNIIYYNDDTYPEKLRRIYAPPQKLYIIGNDKILNEKGIAIIGCRKPSKYGIEMAYKFAYGLSKRGINVISGLARGIDSYSHLGAVHAKGKTIGVLGSGLNNIYPSENKKLCLEIIKNGGAIITEYEPKEKPLAMNFPARNRIISGLSEGILVIEAKQKSGTLITVDHGLDQGKDIFVIPGNITSENSFGTNELIKQGAKLVTNIEEIIEEIEKI